jgi:hypothetical protein
VAAGKKTAITISFKQLRVEKAVATKGGAGAGRPKLSFLSGITWGGGDDEPAKPKLSFLAGIAGKKKSKEGGENKPTKSRRNSMPDRPKPSFLEEMAAKRKAKEEAAIGGGSGADSGGGKSELSFLEQIAAKNKAKEEAASGGGSGADSGGGKSERSFREQIAAKNKAVLFPQGTSGDAGDEDEDVVPQDPLKKGEGMTALLQKTDFSANLACIHGWSSSDKSAWSVSAVVAAMKVVAAFIPACRYTIYILCDIY